MASLNDIKSWFKTGKFPTETQFSEAWSSFWHKAEKISISTIEGLEQILRLKADRELVDSQINDLRANKENVGIALGLVTEHAEAIDAHQELFDLKANDSDVYHREEIDSRFRVHVNDMDLHFTDDEKVKLTNLDSLVNGVEVAQEGGKLNLKIQTYTPLTDVSETPAVSVPVATLAADGAMSKEQAAVVGNLSYQGKALSASGTPSATWQLSNGVNGPCVKNSGGDMELRDGSDSRYVGLTIQNLTVKGNVAVEGESFIVNAKTVETADNLILINKGETGAGVTSGIAGIEIDRGTASNYQIVFDESDDRFKAGQSGNLRTVALRAADSAFTDQHLVKWEASTHSFVDGGTHPTVVSAFTNDAGYTTQSWVQSQGYATVASIPEVTKANIISKLNETGEVVMGQHWVFSSGAGTASTSDMRFKKVLADLNGMLPVVLNAPGFKYRWKDNEDVLIGSSADYWMEHLPEIGFEMDDPEKTKALYYQAIGGVVVPVALSEENAERKKEDQRLQDELDTLRDEVRELKRLVSELRNEIG